MTAPEWLKLLRAWPCYMLIVYTPLFHWEWLMFKLLPYAGEWAYREAPQGLKP